jgi:hypothetical protein
MKNTTNNTSPVSIQTFQTLEEELLIEWNLLRILGIYFCLDRKKAATLVTEQKFFDTISDLREIAKRPVTIAPNAKYGYPSLGALRVFFALLRKYLESGYPIPSEVQFSQRELHRLIGSRSGGFQGKQLALYLLQLRSTIVESRRYKKVTGEWSFRAFTILSDVYLSGKKNSLDYCYVKIDQDLLESINEFYGLRVLYRRLDPLSPTEKILYINLFNALSIVFRKIRKRDGLFYNKDYASVLSAWLPHFKPLQYLSFIKKDQLGPHLDSLVKNRLLVRWNIQKNKHNSGFTLYFYPGEAFFDDYEYINRTRSGQLRLVADHGDKKKGLHDDQKALLTYYFSKLHHADVDAVPDVFTDNNRKFSEKVLATLTLEEAKDFVNYALDEAPKTDYHPILFKGIEQYLLKYLKVKSLRNAAATAKENEELQKSYDDFWRNTVNELREQMTAEELDQLEKEVREQIGKEHVHDITFKMMVRIHTNKRIAMRYKVPTFEEWRKK